MNKSDRRMIKQEKELTIWELTNLMLRNWFFIIIVIIVFLAGGLVYSFVILEQNVTSYSSNKVVLFSEWNYYPAQISYTYADDLKKHINSEFDKQIISSALLKQEKNDDKTIKYTIDIFYSQNIMKSDAEEAAAQAVLWHNQMMDTELEKMQISREQLLNNLKAKYEESKLEYYSFITNADMSLVENMVRADLMQSESEIYFELLKSENEKQLELIDDSSDIEHFYLEPFHVNTTVKSTWKTNIIFSVILGFIAAFILVLLKQSYKSHKSDKSA